MVTACKNPPPARVAHIIPYDGIGGVEVAARSLAAGDHPGPGGGVRVIKLFVSRRGGAPAGPHVWAGSRASEWVPGNYLRAVAELRRRLPRHGAACGRQAAPGQRRPDHAARSPRGFRLLDITLRHRA
jgi:hypothetical protein